MSKEFILVKPSEFVEVNRPPVDWNLCILCQNTSPESLVQPWKGRGRGKSEAKGTSYQSFAARLAKCKELSKVPFNVVPEQFDDGSGIEETLQKNKSQWHKTCRNKFSDFKLDRLKKRASEPDIANSGVTPVKLRRFSIQGAHATGQDVSLCFFCDRGAGIAGLHDVTTMGWTRQFECMPRNFKTRDCWLNWHRGIWWHWRQSITRLVNVISITGKIMSIENEK